MKKRLFATTIAAAALALSLTACGTTGITVAFDDPRPWSGSTGYEKLVYDVEFYKCDSKGNASDLIAEGSYSTAIKENTQEINLIRYGQVDTAFTLTYNDNAAENDRGKTDTIKSSVSYQMTSLASYQSQRVYTAGERENDSQFVSHTLNIDYFSGNASRVMNEKTDKLTFTPGTFYDNEMFLYLSRAQKMDAGAATSFYMADCFESFISNNLVNYTMSNSIAKNLVQRDVGSLKSGFVAPTTEDETPPEPLEGNLVNTLLCTLSISSTKGGPPYFIYYSSDNYKIGEVTHSKIPVYFTYSSYGGTVKEYETRYILNSVSFTE